MVKKVLPPLNTENQVANLPSSGEWKSEDASFLEKLAKKLYAEYAAENRPSNLKPKAATLKSIL